MRGDLRDTRKPSDASHKSHTAFGIRLSPHIRPFLLILRGEQGETAE